MSEFVPAVPAEPAALSRRVWLYGLVAAAAIAGLTVWVAKFGSTPVTGTADAASVLTLVSLVAVGIERIIEVFWSIVGRLKSNWWPLDQFALAVDQLVKDTNVVVEPAFTAAIAGLQDAKKIAGLAQTELDALDAEIRKVETQGREYARQLERIASLAKDSQRVQLLATAAFQAANRLDTAYGSTMPAVRQVFNDVSQFTTGVSDVLAGFKDNPGKKVISIVLGWAIGLIVAGFVGLDLFAAAGAPIGPATAADKATALFPFIGVALTGFVLGLGANPTHEIVKFVTEAAKARRTGNLGVPNVSGSPDDRDERDGAGAAGGAGSRRGRSAGRTEHRIVDRLPGSTATSPKRVQPGNMNLS